MKQHNQSTSRYGGFFNARNIMRIVPNGRQIDAHLLGDSVKFDNTKEGFSAALKWAADAVGALLFILVLILAMSAMEAMS